MRGSKCPLTVGTRKSAHSSGPGYSLKKQKPHKPSVHTHKTLSSQATPARLPSSRQQLRTTNSTHMQEELSQSQTWIHNWINGCWDIDEVKNVGTAVEYMRAGLSQADHHMIACNPKFTTQDLERVFHKIGYIKKKLNARSEEVRDAHEIRKGQFQNGLPNFIKTNNLDHLP